MLSTAHLIAFAATAHPERCRAFYRDTLGLTLIEDSKLALAFDANGTQLRIQKVETVSPVPYTALGWAVASIAEAVAELTRCGVTLERYSFMQQDERGIWLAPSGTLVGWLKDPDGNLLSISQPPVG